MSRTSSHSHRQLHAVCEPYWLCVYCRAHLYCPVCEPDGGDADRRKAHGYERRIATRDHVIAVSTGGSRGRHNMVASCASCNKYKGSLSVEEFQRLLDRRVDLLPEHTGTPLADLAGVRQAVEADLAARASRKHSRELRRRWKEVGQDRL